MAKFENDKSWVAPILEQSLSRVPAPDALWDRIAYPAAPASRPVSNWRFLWVFAATSVAALSVLAVASANYPPALRYGAVEFTSNHVAEVRGWINQRTGLDLPLVTRPDQAVHSLEARVEGDSVQLRYRSGGEAAMLTVSTERNSDSAPTHRQAVESADRSASSMAWSASGKSYKLVAANAEALHAACLACHLDSTL